MKSAPSLFRQPGALLTTAHSQWALVMLADRPRA